MKPRELLTASLREAADCAPDQPYQPQGLAPATRAGIQPSLARQARTLAWGTAPRRNRGLWSRGSVRVQDQPL